METTVEDFYNKWQVNRKRKGDYEDMIEFAKDYHKHQLILNTVDFKG